MCDVTVAHGCAGEHEARRPICANSCKEITSVENLEVPPLAGGSRYATSLSPLDLGLRAYGCIEPWYTTLPVCFTYSIASSEKPALSLPKCAA